MHADVVAGEAITRAPWVPPPGHTPAPPTHAWWIRTREGVELVTECDAFALSLLDDGRVARIEQIR